MCCERVQSLGFRFSSIAIAIACSMQFLINWKSATIRFSKILQVLTIWDSLYAQRYSHNWMKIRYSGFRIFHLKNGFLKWSLRVSGVMMFSCKLLQMSSTKISSWSLFIHHHLTMLVCTLTSALLMEDVGTLSSCFTSRNGGNKKL